MTSTYPLENLLREESVKRKDTYEGTSSSRRVRGLDNDVPSSMASTMFGGLPPPGPPPPSESNCYEDWNDNEDEEMSF